MMLLLLCGEAATESFAVNRLLLVVWETVVVFKLGALHPRLNAERSFFFFF